MFVCVCGMAQTPAPTVQELCFHAEYLSCRFQPVGCGQRSEIEAAELLRDFRSSTIWTERRLTSWGSIQVEFLSHLGSCPVFFFSFSSFTKSAISLGIPKEVRLVMSKCEMQ